MSACFKIFLLVFIAVFYQTVFGYEHVPATLQPIGNFSVPTVTQIAPLISFGQLLVGEKTLLPQFGGNYVKMHHGYLDGMAPNIIYGIRDDLDVAVFIPFTPKSREDSSHSSGVLDMIVQAEYAYFAQTYEASTVTGSIVANLQIPTGSDSKYPRTGNGSCTYFAGTTFAWLSYNWYAFASAGSNFPSPHHHTKFGNAYLYQWGFARYLAIFSPMGWIFNLMIEFDGTYTTKDKIHGTVNHNSGGNEILLTPSIWLSSSRVVLQWGISVPIVQDVHGSMDKMQYQIAYNLGLALQF